MGELSKIEDLRVRAAAVRADLDVADPRGAVTADDIAELRASLETRYDQLTENVEALIAIARACGLVAIAEGCESATKVVMNDLRKAAVDGENALRKLAEVNADEPRRVLALYAYLCEQEANLRSAALSDPTDQRDEAPDS